MNTSTSDVTQAPLTRDELRLMSEIGFLACQGGKVRAAQKNFESLFILKPEHPVPFIGLATARMSAGDPDDAARILREGLAANPADLDIQAILGVALQKARRVGESRRVLVDMLSVEAPDSPSRTLARMLLAQSEGNERLAQGAPATRLGRAGNFA